MMTAPPSPPRHTPGHPRYTSEWPAKTQLSEFLASKAALDAAVEADLRPPDPNLVPLAPGTNLLPDGALPNLATLQLQGNLLSGVLPQNLGTLTSLKVRVCVRHVYHTHATTASLLLSPSPHTFLPCPPRATPAPRSVPFHPLPPAGTTQLIR